MHAQLTDECQRVSLSISPNVVCFGNSKNKDGRKRHAVKEKGINLRKFCHVVTQMKHLLVVQSTTPPVL